MAKLKVLGAHLKTDFKAWKRTPEAKQLKYQLRRMKRSKYGRKLKKNGKKLGFAAKATAKSFRKLNHLPFGRKGFHVGNGQLNNLKYRVKKHVKLGGKLMKAPVTRGLKVRAKRAFSNHRAALLKARLRLNLKNTFHMSPVQQRLAKAHKKKIGLMIRNLARYMKRTARVTDKPKGWHLEEQEEI